MQLVEQQQTCATEPVSGRAVDVLAEVMKLLDTDHDGTVNFTEFENVTSEAAQQQMTQERSVLQAENDRVAAEMKRLKQQLKSSVESADCKLRAMRCVTLLTNRNDSTQILRELDADHSGSVSPQELRVGLQKMGEQISDEVLAEIMKLLDGDGDGSIDITVCHAHS